MQHSITRSQDANGTVKRSVMKCVVIKRQTKELYWCFLEEKQKGIKYLSFFTIDSRTEETASIIKHLGQDVFNEATWHPFPRSCDPYLVHDPTINPPRCSTRTLRYREHITWASILKISDNRRERIE